MRKSGQTAAKVSELKSHAGFWLRFVSNHVSYAFARKLLSSGVTVAEWVVLREMFEKDSMAPSLLARITGLTRGAVSKLIDRLVEKKLVSREACEGDRRFQAIALTPAGRRLVPALAAIADENDEEFFSALTEKERKALIAILRKLVRIHRLNKLPMQ
jgi:DNA-binding MarR family transcriptional regulator